MIVSRYGVICSNIGGIEEIIGNCVLMIFKFCVKLKNSEVFIVFKGFYLLKIIVVMEMNFCLMIVLVEKLLEIDWVKIVLFILFNKFEISMFE